MSEPTRTSIPEPDGATRTGAPGEHAADAAAVAAPPGYELLAEVGSGGMGVVYRARDLDLDREVAVKILLPRFSPESTTAKRFVDEARITGRLQHPGIPAVYRVGALADGRPFLAMKLIAGRTLDDMLKEQNSPAEESGRFLPSFGPFAGASLDRLDAYLRRGRLLAVFEQVAQAVGYAHQQGVIHRDLKPANVMVGAFGEVQVMDWGIARSGDRRLETAVSQGGQQPATVEYAPGSGSGTPQSDLTQAGAILGTPAYMPPEQAIGAVDQVGKHSDVFGLGAILCVILTGKPPYLGADAESNRQLAARAKLDDAFARLDASAAEPELVALAKRCLAPEPADRPRDAGEVATAVAALRADAERRARQAEMDRARAEVQAAEERKRRRVKRALAVAVVGLVAVAGAAGWWVDRERTQRAAEREAEQLREVAAGNARAADLRERRLAHEREVMDAVKEAQGYFRDRPEFHDDPQLWLMALQAAIGPMQRAEKLIKSGDPTDELRRAFEAVSDQWARDFRDRALLVELDRIADSNEIRFLFPISLTTVTSNQFAAAFRKHGVDLAAVPTAEAVAWLKAHRLRDRLVLAVRQWQQSLPTMGLAAVIDTRLAEAVQASAAVAGLPALVALARDPKKTLEKLLRERGLHARLGEILKAVTDDPFTRRWWDAVEDKKAEKLRELVAGPELRRMSSREMASLAEGLNPYAGTSEVLGEFLAVARERFPGEFWVHFRTALLWDFGDPSSDHDPDATYRHLTAALAIRPNSAVARAALGMELIDNWEDGEVEGLRLLRSAAAADPSSPWPHLFLGMNAIEKQNWPEAFRALKEAVRVDPDTGFFMTSAAGLLLLTGGAYGESPPSDAEVVRLLNELVALHPNHPGGYELLGRFHMQAGDHRAALAEFRKARALPPGDFAARPLSDYELGQLEAKDRWEQKLPAVLRGELKPANAAEFAELADYCASFEQKFALATKLVAEGVEADPKLLDDAAQVIRFAGWAVRAGTGHGADGDTVPLVVRQKYRRMALRWLNETRGRQKGPDEYLGILLQSARDLAPVRDPKALADLPPAEREQWEAFWAEVPPLAKPTPKEKPKRKLRPGPRAQPPEDLPREPNPPPGEIAPPPREVKM